ncbi:MAG: hypothetical protein AAGH57_10855 [Pseudomonadota bacterium]
MSEEELNKDWEEAKGRFFESDYKKRMDMSNEYAQLAYRYLFLLNGGAVLALLTLLGNTQAEADAGGIFNAFIWFAGGLASVLVGVFSYHASQSASMLSSYYKSMDSFSKLAGGQGLDESDIHHKRANVSLLAARFFAAVSLLCFVCGSVETLFAIQ